MNATLAKGVAVNVTGVTAAGIGGAVGGTTGAGAGLSVDANNRQLHFDEKQRIAIKANGDKKLEERLTKAACYEVKCWAQFPEGTLLYKLNYVSNSEAGDLGQELAWVRDQKASDAFIYTPFQRFTDGVAAATKFSSLNGKGTFDGEFISKPNAPLRGKDCATAECAAGIEPPRGSRRVDYVSGQLNFYVLAGSMSLNLHNGDVYGAINFGRSYPNYSIRPGISISAGSVIGKNNAQATSTFLNGGGGQVSGFTPAPFAPWLGVGGGLNHSYGGSTAIEGGISIPPGYGVSPAGYSTEFHKGSRQ
jgi:filamentous hemagglutinin